jgi:SAM-dependent methyltransferase
MATSAEPVEIDFDALYRGESPYPEGHPLRAVFRDILFWDIGGPQPVIAELAMSGAIRGRVLDVGCGPGDHVIYLAARGHQVTGIDIAPTAIRRAIARADELGLDIEFLVADATTLDGVAEQQFDTVLDSGLYDSLSPSQRRAYLAALGKVVAPGARLHLYCVGDLVPPEIVPPHRYTAADISRALTSAGWVVYRFVRTTYTANPAITRDALRQAVTVTNATGGQEFVASLNIDGDGRLLLPGWLITAHRTEDVG